MDILCMNIIETILYNNLEVRIYHNRGHFRKTPAKVKKFIESFTRHNFLGDSIDEETACNIIYYNDMIDNYTRSMLQDPSTFPDKLNIPDYLARNDLDLNHYKELLNI